MFIKYIFHKIKNVSLKWGLIFKKSLVKVKIKNFEILIELGIIIGTELNF